MDNNTYRAPAKNLTPAATDKPTIYSPMFGPPHPDFLELVAREEASRPPVVRRSKQNPKK